MKIHEDKKTKIYQEFGKHTQTQFIMDECIEFVEKHLKELNQETISRLIFPGHFGHLKQALLRAVGEVK